MNEFQAPKSPWVCWSKNRNIRKNVRFSVAPTGEHEWKWFVSSELFGTERSRNAAIVSAQKAIDEMLEGK